MKYFIVALAFACIAQGTFARVARAAPKKSEAEAGVDQLIANAKVSFEELSNKILTTLGVENSESLIKQVKEGTNKVAKDLNTLANQFAEEAKKREPAVQEIVGQYQATIKSLVDKVKADNPEASASAQKMQENLQQTVNKLIEESKKIEKQLKDDTSGIREDIAKFTKNAIDKAVAGAKEVQKKVEEAVAAKKP